MASNPVEALLGKLDSIQLRIIDALGSKTIVLVALAIGFGLYAAAIIATPYSGDDLINKDIREYLATHETSLGEVIVSYTGWWMQSQGRFFPGSLSWTYTLFYVFDSRIEYKIVLVAVAIAAVAVASALAWAISRNRSVPAVFALLALSTLQVRAWYDGLTSYAGLLPLTTALALGACLILIKRPGVVWGIVAGFAYLYALFTYETTLLFAPALVAVVYMVTRSWRRTVPIIIPALVEAAIAVSLRVTMVPTEAPAYTLNFALGDVTRALFRQMTAAIPLSQWWYGYPGVSPIPNVLIVLVAVFLGIPTFFAVRAFGRRRVEVPRFAAPLLLGTGAWIWLSSSALVSVTSLWQTEMPAGQGYLAVIYGYFSLTMILTGLWILGNRRFIGATATGKEIPRSLGSLLWQYSSALVIASLLVLTIAGNLSLVD